MGNVCDRWLGCCCFGGETKEASLQFIPSSRRNCTDVLFLLLYLASWAGLIAVLIVAAKRGGDPEKIYHGVNYNGDICGRTAATASTPYAAWVAMPQTPTDVDACSGCYAIMTCISDCAATQSDPSMRDHYTSERLMNYCIPRLDATSAAAYNVTTFPYDAEFNSATNLASRAFVDLYTVWPIILIAAFVALIFSFLYTALSKHFAGALVLTTIALLTTGGFLTAYALLRMAASADATTASGRATAMRGVGIAVAVLTAVFLLVVLALRKRIYIAVEVVKEASRAVLDMWELVLFPLFPFVVGCGYFVLFIVTTLYIASVWTSTTTPLPPYILAHNPLPSTTYQQHSWDQSLKNAFAYVFLHLLWTIQFLVYLTFMVVAGCVANWYFTPRDAQQQKVRGEGEGQLSHFPVLQAVYRTLRFHLGTVALASLIIAVIQFVRAVLAYVEEQTTPRHGPPNRLQRAVFCLLQCCLRCVQCCMDKVNKNALVWCAIYGDSFGESACSSFALIWANLARVAALSVVSAFLMLMGKLLVAAITTGVAAIAMYKHYDQAQVSSLVVPVVVIFLLAYLVASLFMSMVETTSSTVFLCFLVDEKFNKQSGRMLASEGLQSVINAHREEGEKWAAREQQKAAVRVGGLGGAPAMPAVGGGPGVSAAPVYAVPHAGVPQAVQLTTAPSKMV